MAPTLLIDLFSEQRFLISDLCTFLGHPVERAGYCLFTGKTLPKQAYLSHKTSPHKWGSEKNDDKQ